MLLSDAFKDQKRGQTSDQIDKDSLLIFGQFHCIDRLIPMDKAICFYELLQEGGLERHAVICASDKDFKPRFSKICALVTTDLFKFASPAIENLYVAEEQALKNAVDDILNGEDQFLDVMYGYNSTLKA